MNYAFSTALAGESLDLSDKFDSEKEEFNHVTFADFQRFAAIVAYKVAANLERGSVMDPALNPLHS